MCKFNFTTCQFKKNKVMCNNCEDGSNYQWDETKSHGGKRDGAGRKPKYNEPTTTIAFRVPLSKLDKVKQAVDKIIKEGQT